MGEGEDDDNCLQPIGLAALRQTNVPQVVEDRDEDGGIKDI